MTDEALSALAEALRPFADEGRGWGTAEQYDDSVLELHNLTIGDVRRARTAYESIPAIIARAAKAEERVKELEGVLRAMLEIADMWAVVTDIKYVQPENSETVILARAVLEKG